MSKISAESGLSRFVSMKAKACRGYRNFISGLEAAWRSIVAPGRFLSDHQLRVLCADCWRLRDDMVEQEKGKSRDHVATFLAGSCRKAIKLFFVGGPRDPEDERTTALPVIFWHSSHEKPKGRTRAVTKAGKSKGNKKRQLENSGGRTNARKTSKQSSEGSSSIRGDVSIRHTETG
ncbi:hypothetical protein C8R44DRAFT_752577 [Mycena epipterygia]|nr:hypothetical protein C8R44DRAFT_752577 [Mycena epipterygia]